MDHCLDTKQCLEALPYDTKPCLEALLHDARWCLDELLHDARWCLDELLHDAGQCLHALLYDTEQCLEALPYNAKYDALRHACWTMSWGITHYCINTNTLRHRPEDGLRCREGVKPPLKLTRPWGISPLYWRIPCGTFLSVYWTAQPPIYSMLSTKMSLKELQLTVAQSQPTWSNKCTDGWKAPVAIISPLEMAMFLAMGLVFPSTSVVWFLYNPPPVRDTYS